MLTTTNAKFDHTSKNNPWLVYDAISTEACSHQCQFIWKSFSIKEFPLKNFLFYATGNLVQAVYTVLSILRYNIKYKNKYLKVLVFMV